MSLYRSQILSAILGVLVLISAANAQEGGRAIHDRLSNLLVSGQISRVTIIHVPSDIETRIQVDQQALRALSPIEFSFTNLGEGRFPGPLKSALGEIRTARPAENHEVRWGILFLDATGKERSAVFLDSTGRFMQVDKSRLLVQGQLLAAIKRMIRDAIK